MVEYREGAEETSDSQNQCHQVHAMCHLKRETPRLNSRPVYLLVTRSLNEPSSPASHAIADSKQLIRRRPKPIAGTETPTEGRHDNSQPGSEKYQTTYASALNPRWWRRCPSCMLFPVTSVGDEEVEGSRHGSFDPQVSDLPPRPGNMAQLSFC